MIRLAGIRQRAGATAILDGIDVAIHAGAPTLLMGPNGSGKTTLLRLMMGLAAPTEGRVDLALRADGQPLRRAFVFQKPVMLKRRTADNVAFALVAAGREASRSHVARLLDQVGLGELAARPARKLSAGEQQRLALARALARAPDVLLLDEPTASLDPAQTQAVEAIITAAANAGVKIVMATHDVGQARRIGGDIMVLVRGRLVEHTPANDFFKQPRTPEARRFIAGDLVI